MIRPLSKTYAMHACTTRHSAPLLNLQVRFEDVKRQLTHIAKKLQEVADKPVPTVAVWVESLSMHVDTDCVLLVSNQALCFSGIVALFGVPHKKHTFDDAIPDMMASTHDTGSQETCLTASSAMHWEMQDGLHDLLPVMQKHSPGYPNAGLWCSYHSLLIFDIWQSVAGNFVCRVHFQDCD